MEQHTHFLDVVNACVGNVIISGYDNALYESKLRKWNRAEFSLPNNAAGGSTKRRMTEVCWMNF